MRGVRRSAVVLGCAIVALACVAASACLAAIGAQASDLTVSFLPVASGEAVFIRAPGGRIALIDGGPDAGVLRQLGQQLPWWQRSIDVLVASTPDPNDVGGLVDVLGRYRAGLVVQSDIESTDPSWASFERQVAALQKSGVPVDIAQRGQAIDLGGGAYLEVLFPDRSLPNVDPENGCVVLRLVYGSTAFLLPCEASPGVEDYLARLDGSGLRSDVLAVSADPSPLFLGYVSPTDIVATDCSQSPDASLAQFGAQVLQPCGKTITFVSDGSSVVEE